MNRDNSFFEFDAENSISSTSKKPRWLVLSVEDNDTFQQSLVNALSRMIVQGHTMEVLTASSAEEARLILEMRPDINLILLDVVMETDDAGLRLVEHIRSTLNNPIIRIILLTGQPGAAPNRDVMEQYDIDDYWSKTDLGEEHLFNVMNGNLKTWHRMNELKNARQGLERVVTASQAISRQNNLPHFSQAVLEEIDRIIGITDGGIMSLKMTEPLDLEKGSAVLAATGQYQPYIGQPISTLENEILLKRIKKTIQQKQHMFVGRYSLLYFSFEQPNPVYYLIVVKSATSLTDSNIHLLKVFGENIYNGFANIALTEYLNELAFKHWQTGIYNRNWFCQQLAVEEYWAKQAQIVLIDSVILR
jgi:CheY-like chemotaxis protein